MAKMMECHTCDSPTWHDCILLPNLLYQPALLKACKELESAEGGGREGTGGKPLRLTASCSQRWARGLRSQSSSHRERTRAKSAGVILEACPSPAEPVEEPTACPPLDCGFRKTWSRELDSTRLGPWCIGTIRQNVYVPCYTANHNLFCSIKTQ